MLTPSKYKASLMRSGSFAGESKKSQSDIITESSWYEDLATKTCYLYDFYHDNEPLKLEDLHPDERYQIPIDIKYIVNSYQTLEKDQVSYHIMLKPSEEGHDEIVPYYKEYFKDRYGATFPVGLYIAVPDAKGKYNRWLVVDRANVNDPQYPTYEILRCDYLFQYIYEHKKYQITGVLRSQNSYNSGIWEAYITTAVEDQQKFAVPLTRETEHLWYNLRMVIDNDVENELELRCWEITKINRIAPNGIARITLAQTMYNPLTDYVERDKDGKILGKWCDYYSNGEIIPTNPAEPDTDIYCELSTTGKPVIKLNDCYKTFSVQFYRQGEEINYKQGAWSFAVKQRESGTVIKLNDPSILLDVLYYGDPQPQAKKLKENQIKIKYIGDTEYLNWILIVTFIEDVKKITSSIEVNITTLS